MVMTNGRSTPRCHRCHRCDAHFDAGWLGRWRPFDGDDPGAFGAESDHSVALCENCWGGWLVWKNGYCRGGIRPADKLAQLIRERTAGPELWDQFSLASDIRWALTEGRLSPSDIGMTQAMEAGLWQMPEEQI